MARKNTAEVVEPTAPANARPIVDGLEPGPVIVTAPDAAKRERRVSVAIDTEVMAVTFTVKGGDSFTLNAADYSPEVRRHAELHGFNQKVKDTVAGMKDATVEDVLATMKQAAADLKEGWSVRGTGEAQDETILTEAIGRFIASRYADETVRATKQAKASQPEVRTLLKAAAEVKAIVAEIKAERARAKVTAPDAASVLDD